MALDIACLARALILRLKPPKITHTVAILLLIEYGIGVLTLIR